MEWDTVQVFLDSLRIYGLSLDPGRAHRGPGEPYDFFPLKIEMLLKCVCEYSYILTYSSQAKSDDQRREGWSFHGLWDITTSNVPPRFVDWNFLNPGQRSLSRAPANFD